MKNIRVVELVGENCNKYSVEQQKSLLGLKWWSREQEMIECLHEVYEDITFSTKEKALEYIKKHFSGFNLVEMVKEKVRYMEDEIA